MTRIGPRICLKAQGPLCPNLSQKVQKEVSQMANCNLSRMMLLGGLSVNLNHLIITNEKIANIVSKYHHQSRRTRLAEKLLNSPLGLVPPLGNPGSAAAYSPVHVLLHTKANMFERQEHV